MRALACLVHSPVLCCLVFCIRQIVAPFSCRSSRDLLARLVRSAGIQFLLRHVTVLIWVEAALLQVKKREIQYVEKIVEASLPASSAAQRVTSLNEAELCFCLCSIHNALSSKEKVPF